MRRESQLIFLILVVSLAMPSLAAKGKSVNFGKWLPVKMPAANSDEPTIPMKIRALIVNGDMKEFTTGQPHQVTEDIFVVQRASRLNDSLPGDDPMPKWKWFPAGWLQVNRQTGRITSIKLPEYDSFYSSVSWYRDFVAYCGIGDDEGLYAMVVQLGQKKPILKKRLGEAKYGDQPNSECGVPVWQRDPLRISFQPIGGNKVTFTLRSHGLELEPESESTASEPAGQSQ